MSRLDTAPMRAYGRGYLAGMAHQSVYENLAAKHEAIALTVMSRLGLTVAQQRALFEVAAVEVAPFATDPVYRKALAARRLVIGLKDGLARFEGTGLEMVG